MDHWQLLEQAYLNQENYLVVNTPQAEEPDLAVIYFSSVGTFNAENCQKRLNEDYYEFHRNRVKRAGRHIYVRDVTLSFYTIGINQRINTLSKLLNLLRELTNGYRVATLGVSSGGFMAMLCGAVLKADYVISFSGQIDICDEIPGYIKARPQWISSQIAPQNPYYNNKKLLQDAATRVFQLEAAYCEIDRPNAAILKQMNNVRLLEFDSSRHGGMLTPRCVGRFINLLPSEIEALSQQYQNKVISQGKINRRLLSFGELMAYYFTIIRKKMFKIKFNAKTRRFILLGITFIDRDLTKKA